jgi:hypothetical protein
MEQPAYRRSEGHPMRRFAFFSVALFVLVIIGSVPWKAGGLNKSACVCVPSRARLMLKSMTNLSVIRTTTTAAKR